MARYWRGISVMAAETVMEGASPPKLLDRVREAVRVRHYSRRG